MFDGPVKRALPTLALALPLALSATPASARDTHAARASASDFELAPAAGQVRRASNGGVMSKPLRAPRRFDLLGMRWRGRSHPDVHVRVRRDGAKWSRWADLGGDPDGGPDPGAREGNVRTTTAPAWSGRSDWVQYRLSRPAAGLRIHFVDAHVRAQKIATRSQVGAPPMLPRASWGADQCPPRVTPDYGEVKVAFVHHTVSINDYTPDDVPAMILGICRYHRNSNGWNDIGYNFLVDKFGRIWEGRAGGVDKAVVGAQAQGYNAQSTGIANLGTFSSVPQTDAAIDAMARLIRWKLPLHGQPTAGAVQVTSAGGSSNRYPNGTEVTLQRVSGHRDVDATSCPGDSLYAQLQSLRGKVGNVEPSRPRTKIGAAISAGVLTYGQTARVSGRLQLMKGGAAGGLPVNVQMFISGKWVTIARTTSAGDGSWSVSLKPSAKRIMRAQFPGNGSYVASSSRQVVVQVRPVLTLSRAAAHATVGDRAILRGRVTPRKSRILLIVRKRVGKVDRKLGTLKLRAKGGRFSASHRLRGPGLYSYQAVFPGDRNSLAASSVALHVRASGSRSGGAYAR
ncbi:MAG TPA: peptidoglycan recognition protein [Thermoleophilaceae bacterium]